MTPSIYVTEGRCYPFKACWRRVDNLHLCARKGQAPMLFFHDSEDVGSHIDALVNGADFCVIKQHGKFVTIMTVLDGSIFTSLDVMWLGSQTLDSNRAFDFPEDDGELLSLTLQSLMIQS